MTIFQVKWIGGVHKIWNVAYMYELWQKVAIELKRSNYYYE